MNFHNVENFVKTKLSELKLPYFKILVKKDGKELFSYRYSEYKNDNDLLTMYSMSKVITSVCFMMLVEKGLVNANDLVSKYLPGYDDLKLMDGSKVKTPMTIKHLLTMSGGLDYNFGRRAIQKAIKENPDITTSELVSLFPLDRLNFEPGEKFSYSLCLDAVGGLIEKISGMNFAKFAKENIFNVCDMKDSTLEYSPNLVKKTLPDVKNVDGNICEADKYERLILLSKNYSSGGSSLISTVDDFSKFADKLASGKLLNSESIKEMATPYILETPFNDTVQQYSKASFDYGYGYGVRVRKVSNHNIPLGEFGWDGATGSYCLIDPVNKISIVMGMTIQNWPDYIKDLHMKIVESIYKEIYNI